MFQRLCRLSRGRSAFQSPHFYGLDEFWLGMDTRFSMYSQVCSAVLLCVFHAANADGS